MEELMKKIFLLSSLFIFLSAGKSFAVKQQVCEYNSCADMDFYRAGKSTIECTVTATEGDFNFYYSEITIVQGTSQMGLNPFGSTDIDAYVDCTGVSLCMGEIKEGVQIIVTINSFPEWFNINQSFIVYYGDTEFHIDANVPTTTIKPTTTTTIPVEPPTLGCEVKPVNSLEGTLWKAINEEDYIGFYRGYLYRKFETNNDFTKYGKIIEFGNNQFLMRYGFIVALQINLLGKWECNDTDCWMDETNSIRLFFIPLISSNQYDLVCSDWAL